MIPNERQYKITKSQSETLKKALLMLNIDERTEKLGSKLLATAERDALQSEIEVLEQQLKEFEDLRSGMKSTIVVESISEIPRLLVQARIMQRLTQKDLANLVGIKEQQIQRYESEQYRSASMQRAQTIADKLNIRVEKIKATIGNHERNRPGITARKKPV